MKRYFALVFMALLVFALACDSEDGGDSSKLTALTLGQDYTGTLPADGTQCFVFTSTDAGNYQVSLTGLDTDCGWIIMEYVSENTDYLQIAANDSDPNGCDDYDDNSDEVYTGPADAATKYVILVYNNDSSAGSAFILNVSAAK